MLRKVVLTIAVVMLIFSFAVTAFATYTMVSVATTVSTTNSVNEWNKIATERGLPLMPSPTPGR